MGFIVDFCVKDLTDFRVSFSMLLVRPFMVSFDRNHRNDYSCFNLNKNHPNCPELRYMIFEKVYIIHTLKGGQADKRTGGGADRGFRDTGINLLICGINKKPLT
jgi:hypothetical protein